MATKKTAGKETDDVNAAEKTEFQEMFLEICNKSIKAMKEGQIIKGVIVGITKKEALIDIGYKSEGIIPLSEFDNGAQLKVGDEIEVLLESKENDHGMVVLSKRKADRTIGWQRILDGCKEGDTITGKVLKKVKGGLMVDIGIEAFLPASQVGKKGAINNLDQFVGQTIQSVIIKINKLRKNVVLSRREFLQKERELLKLKLFDELGKGQIISGTVKNITDFGAFIDLGGVDGLLHITDISWGRISHPSEMLAIGDKLELMVLDVDKTNMKISLGLKQKTPSPWEDVASKYPLGTKVKGKVVNIVPYGAFVELEKGVEGLVHISEFSWTRRISNPSEMLAIGDIIEAKVLTMDKENQKIALGIKQLESDPWIGVAQRYPAGTKVKGKVRNVTDYGAFVEIEEGIEGLVHVSDISWTKKTINPQDLLKKGQKVEAIVLSSDELNHKISLGLKQLSDDPWPDIEKRYSDGSEWEGTIIKIANFGIFVELEPDLEGLLSIQETDTKQAANLQVSYKPGDKIKVKILKNDAEQHKISLAFA